MKLFFEQFNVSFCNFFQIKYFPLFSLILILFTLILNFIYCIFICLLGISHLAY